LNSLLTFGFGYWLGKLRGKGMGGFFDGVEERMGEQLVMLLFLSFSFRIEEDFALKTGLNLRGLRLSIFLYGLK
jgi:hypothetical protein